MEIIGACVLVWWLFMARRVARWSLELDGGSLDFRTVLVCLLLWPVGYAALCEDWHRKNGRRSLSDATTRLLVGESRWHRRERRAREHEERCKDVGEPVE